jgi:hypothetical protein
MGEFETYKSQVTSAIKQTGHEASDWKRLFDWYEGEGRALFIAAFQKETTRRVNLATDPQVRVGAAIPKSFADYEAKLHDDAFYRAHAEWFIEEMDWIIKRVPRESDQSDATFAYGNVLRFVQHVLLDSAVLFTHWGEFRAGVPDVYGIGKNEMAHLMNFYQSARQTIYGHGSFGLSFVENHSDIAIGTIRQAIELRLRRAFGLIGKVSRHDQSFHPVPLSDLIEAIDVVEDGITFPIHFENIKRINSWANLFMHYGFKFYAWAPARVLEYIRPFLIGGTVVNGTRTVDSGVVATQSAFDRVRTEIRTRVEAEVKFDIALDNPKYCDVVICPAGNLS